MAGAADPLRHHTRCPSDYWGYFEQAVVFEKIAGDRALKIMVPCDEAAADDLAPEIFKVWINVAMAYAMGTQNGNYHVISL